MWIHEYKSWPDFTWDYNLITPKLSIVRHKQGMLLGKITNLGFDLRQEAKLNTLTHDVVKSSAIEGENLDTKEVRSSIAKKLGIDIPDYCSSNKKSEGMVEIMIDATQNFLEPLTKKRVCSWHAALFPTAKSGMREIIVGKWRTAEVGAMQVVSGPMGKEKVHFEAPDAVRLEQEMNLFFSWFNEKNNVEPIIKAAIAHLWFVTIHPFEDGNGRITRAISDMLLSRADNTSDRFYSLSNQIEQKRKDYYLQLERQQRKSTNITLWIEWFLDCIEISIDNTEKILDKILFKAELWKKINHNATKINNRQNFIINKMLESDFEGHMNTSKYAKITKCSNDTALRDIQELQKRRIFIKNNAGGRSTSYRLTNKIDGITYCKF